jgi:hypothetical protein
MMEWPATLPQYLPVSGYQEQPPDTTLRTSMDAGPAKLRRRYTANVRNITATLMLSEAQLRTLDAFYVTDTRGGSLPFDWVHPRYAGESPSYPVTMRFIKQPSYAAVEPDYYSAQLELEIMP